MAKKTPHIIIALLFFAMLLLPQPVQYLFGKKLTVTAENRNLAPFPKRFKWRKLAPELEEFYNDRIPFRNDLLSWCGKIQEKLFPFTLGNVIPGENDFCFYVPRTQENTLQQFNGKVRLSYYEMEKNRRFLEKLHRTLAAKKIDFLLVVAPDKIQIYPEYLPERRRYSESFDAPSTKFRRHLDNAASPVPRLFLKDTLLESKKFSDKLFYRADTHWNRVGGYLGAREIISHFTQGKTTLPKAGEFMVCALADQYEPDDMKNQLLHRKTFKKYHESIPVVPQFQGKIETVAPGHLRTRNPDAPDKRKVLIYRDSFTTNMTPYLSNHFAEVHYLWTHQISMAEIGKISPDLVVLEYVARLLVKMQNKLR